MKTETKFFAWGEAIKWLVGALQLALVYIAADMANQIKNATVSINQLNVNIAVLMSRSTNQETLNTNFDSRIRELERRGIK